MFNFIQVAQAQVLLPGDIIKNIYDTALLVGGILAFGAIIYGAARYTLAAGNPSGQHEGKESITQALLGLLLLFSAYLILHTINPNLTNLTLPKLTALKVEPGTPPIPSGKAMCRLNCVDSPGVRAIINCLPRKPQSTKDYGLVRNTTYQDVHRLNSCHFGGRLCTDGAHAIDWGINAARSFRITLPEMIIAVEECGRQTSTELACRCETSSSATVSCTDPAANHVHCNVNVLKDKCDCR